MPLLHQQKIPVGIIQAVPEALALPEAQALLLEQNGLRGVRTFIAHREGEKKQPLLPPPHLGEHTHEFNQE
jgi:crotonobetainyl-CoA:carnitine CoA-transferase CaiB-like acyl-CoA transferase